MRVKPGRVVLYAFLAALLVGAITAVSVVVGTITQTRWAQEQLASFYTPPDLLPGPPGTVIRTEPLVVPQLGTTVDVEGGTAYRMLYVTDRPDGTPLVSGAMYFVPDTPAPPEGRPVVAWAHGTVGMGDSCAPSRSAKPISQLTAFLPQMLERGWVVVATDYAGLGTPGPQQYLVGQSEARDVVNSVRAVRSIPDVNAGSRYVVMGHSQGGHSSLWTGMLSSDLAPDLRLDGVLALAPAAELRPIVGVQWNQAAGWAIGPSATVGWTSFDPSLPLDGTLTQAGLENYLRLADECIMLSALEGIARSDLGRTFFAVDPDDVPAWSSLIADQTPTPLPADLPVWLAQGTADDVVLPWPNAILQESWCAAGSTITALWLEGVGHLQMPFAAGPDAVPWIADRFAGLPAPSSCDVPPPVPPSPPSP